MSDTGRANEAKELGERMKAARSEKGLSVAELARLAEVSKAYIHQIENGDCQRPSAQVLFGIATVLETSVAHLLGKGPSGPESGVVRIPESLQKFAASNPELKQEDVQMLARIKHRGEQPKNEDDWAYLWESIKRSVK